MIRCAICSCIYTPETIKGEYIYYRPVNGKKSCICTRIKEELILNEVYKFLKEIQFPSNLLRCIENELNNNSDAEQIYCATAITKISKEKKLVTEELDNLLKLNINQSITWNEGDKKCSDLTQKRDKCNSATLQLKDYSSKRIIPFNTLQNLASRIFELFEHATTEQKHKIVMILFQDILIHGKTIELSMHEGFAHMQK